MTEKKMIQDNFEILEKSVSESSLVFNAISAGIKKGLIKTSRKEKRQEFLGLIIGVTLILAGMNYMSEPFLNAIARYVPEITIWIADVQSGATISLAMLVRYVVKASLHVSIYLWTILICFGFASGGGQKIDQKLHGAIL